MTDVVIVGAGPAGAVAATLLARAGVRVRLFDRAVFPRDKLCGDTLNPGTLAVLERLGIGAAVRERALPLDGMIVTGPGGVRVRGRYPAGLHALSIRRYDLDAALVSEAVSAGAVFEPATSIQSAVVAGGQVTGINIAGKAGLHPLQATAVIAADGRHSTLAFALGLAKHPPSPRRWAIGAYFEGVTGLTGAGEMHIREGRYIGVAPTPGGLTNVCLVLPAGAGDSAMRNPSALLQRELAGDRLLADRFSSARIATVPAVLGPLAVDATGRQIDGLVLAGDAGGFIDPMTGDGLRFAVHGGALAARAVMRALEHGWAGVHEALELERQRDFGPKWRFNRALRALVASPIAVRAASVGARIAPAGVRLLVGRAGDCGLASQ